METINACIILFICFFLLPSINLYSQSTEAFVQLDDASGFDTATALPSLKAAADELIANLPPELQDSFKVFDFGFYLLHNDFSEGLPTVFQDKVNEVELLSPYYLLFGKQTDTSGIYTKLWLDINLPNEDEYPCLTLTTKAYLTSLTTSVLENSYSSLGNDPASYYVAEITSMELLSRKLNKLMSCCQLTKSKNNRKSNEVCDNTYDIDELVAFLKSLGANGIAYCKICDVTDTYNNSSTSFRMTDDSKIRCIFGEIQPDNTLLQKIFDAQQAWDPSNIISNIPEFSDFPANDDDLILTVTDDQLNRCEARENYPGFCTEGNEDILTYTPSLKLDISRCLLETREEFFVERSSEKDMNQTHLDDYLLNLREWLNLTGYEGAYYLYKPQEKELRIISRNQDVTTSDPFAMARHLGEYKSKDYFDNANFGVWMDYMNGELRINVDFDDELVTPNPDINKTNVKEVDIASKLKDIIHGKLNLLQNFDALVYEEETLGGDIEDDGVLKISAASIFKFIAFAVEESSEVLTTGKLNEALWNNDNEYLSEYETKLINFYAPVAGASDQTIQELADAIELLELLKEIYHKPKETITLIYESVAALDLETMKAMIGEAVQQEIESFTTPGRKRQYHITRRSIQATTTIIFIATKGWKVAIDFVHGTADFIKRFKEFISDFGNFDFGTKISRLEDKLKRDFFNDFNEIVAEAKLVFDEIPSMVDAWVVLKTNNITGSKAIEMISENQPKWIYDGGDEKLLGIVDEFKYTDVNGIEYIEKLEVVESRGADKKLGFRKFIDFDEPNKGALSSNSLRSGLPPTSETIRQGTVRYTDSTPEVKAKVDAMLDEFTNDGFIVHVNQTQRFPQVNVRQIIEKVDGKWQVVREEKILFVGDNMQVIDLEHEFDHLLQIRRIEAQGVKVVVERGQLKDEFEGVLKPAADVSGVLTQFDDVVLEYHTRLKEFIRLKERVVDEEILQFHAKEIIEHRNRYTRAVNPRNLRSNNRSKLDTYLREFKTEIQEFTDRYFELGGDLYENN